MRIKDKLDKGIRNPTAAFNYLLRNAGIRYQRPNLSHIILYANSICNAKCLMCDIGQNNKRGIQAMICDETIMPLALLQKLLADPLLRKKRVTFNITMTEPLLTPNIGEYITAIKNEGHNVNVTTNGLLLEKKADELIKSKLDSVQVSIDGPPAVNDWIRGQEGFFEKAIKGIKKLGGKIPVRINCTVSNLNYQYLKEFADALNERVKVGLLKFQFLDFVSEEMSKKQDKFKFKQSVSSIDTTVDPERVDTEELWRQMEELKRTKYKNIKKIVFIPDLKSREEVNRYFKKEGLPLKEYSFCRWPFSQIAVNTNGDVAFNMRCFNYVIGNLNRQNLRQVFYSKAAREFRREFIKAGMCFPACMRCCGVMFS